MIKFIVLLLLCPLGLSAQSPDTLSTDSVKVISESGIVSDLEKPSDNGGVVHLYDTPKLRSLLKWHVYENRKNKSFSGYRIQIYSVNSYGCDINKLKQIRDTFEVVFKTIPAYLKYFDPDFKIRVGNFHTRLESIPLLHRIRRWYPASYPVKTVITLEDLKRVPMQDLEEDSEVFLLSDDEEEETPR